MKTVIRSTAFETNSSTSHTIALATKPFTFGKLHFIEETVNTIIIRGSAALEHYSFLQLPDDKLTVILGVIWDCPDNIKLLEDYLSEYFGKKVIIDATHSKDLDIEITDTLTEFINNIITNKDDTITFIFNPASFVLSTRS